MEKGREKKEEKRRGEKLIEEEDSIRGTATEEGRKNV